MPLLDHFHPPLQRERHWEGLHSQWAGSIVRSLNETVLPAGYHAEPQIRLGADVEIDVATLEEGNGPPTTDGSVATLTYAPPGPPLVFRADFANLDAFAVKVYDDGLRLAAAIELVSPANKDRPGHRAAFVRKCASYLQENVALVIVDIVTSRGGNLHADLVTALAPTAALDCGAARDDLYTVAYRPRASATETAIDAWPQRLEVGQPLPTLPLWIDAGLAVPIDLEQSYLEACRSLRIRTP